MRVIVTGDSTLLREVVMRLLEEPGLAVAGQAGDAEELMRRMRAHRPDVAVVDVRMPLTDAMRRAGGGSALAPKSSRRCSVATAAGIRSPSPLAPPPRAGGPALSRPAGLGIAPCS